MIGAFACTKLQFWILVVIEYLCCIQKHALWSVEQVEIAGEERGSFGGFPNLMRLLYYLEQINVGLPRDEMFRIALAIRQLTVTHPINRAR